MSDRLIIKSAVCSASVDLFRSPTEEEADIQGADFQKVVEKEERRVVAANESEGLNVELVEGDELTESQIEQNRKYFLGKAKVREALSQMRRPSPKILVREKIVFTEAQISKAKIVGGSIKIGRKTLKIEGQALVIQQDDERKAAQVADAKIRAATQAEEIQL